MSVGPYDPGNLVTQQATFAGDPTEVRFSYLAPGSSSAVNDSGFSSGVGNPGTNMTRVTTGVYKYSINASQPGTYTWRFWGTGANQGSKYGTFVINPQLGGL
jgi:hypothetical protein